MGAGFLGLILVALGVTYFGGYYEHSTETTVIVDKERVCDSSGSGQDQTIECKYLIFTESGTYELTDSLFAGRWSSSDAYGRLKRCHTYEIESYGWRIAAFSMYPNIVKATDLGRVENCEN